MVNSLNLQEIDQEQALNLIRFYIKNNQNVLLLGRRGSGKTEISIQSILDCGFKVNYINLSVIDRSDLVGFPDLQATGDLITFKSPHFLPKLKPGEKPKNILLFDEVDKCPPEVTAPLLEILQFRTINGQNINAAGCILTGNLMNEGAYSRQISSALLDRTAKYVLNFSLEKWLEWAKLNNIHDLIISFLTSNQDLACGKEEETYYASPSARGWTLASKALIKAQAAKMADIETITSIISGYVGCEAGLKFRIWYQHYRHFEPYIISFFENGELSIDYNALPPTEKVIFCITMCYLAKLRIINSKATNKFQALELVCNFMDNNKVDSEMQVLAIRNAFSPEFIAKNKLYSNQIFFNKFKKIQESISIKK